MIIKNGKHYKVIVIIPARKGSKRIPYKNIKEYAGKPLIFWSIYLAKMSKYVDDVIVSTDCEDIANISKKYGATVPFLRPENISGDLATDYEFMNNYIEWLIANKLIFPDIIIHLRTTYPNRKLSILNDCIEQFATNIDKYDSLRTVCITDKPPYKMYTINNINNNTLSLIPLFDKVLDIVEPYNMPGQILPPTYWHNGYIDILKPQTIILYNSVSGKTIYPYIMDKNEIYDIDTEEEWAESENKFIKKLIG
jgi:CMP-N,N'-diacetyllegionaminic acid synthase